MSTAAQRGTQFAKVIKEFIVIPAYNEERKIGEVLKDLIFSGHNNIVIVDDGSKDNTSEIASKYNISVIRHPINRGQGAALKTGIDFALSEGADIIVTFDSDGQHCVEEIPSLTESIKNGEVDVVLGSRFIKENSTPFVRKMFLKGGAQIIRLLYGVKLTDSHNGLRALSREACQRMELKCDKMEHASEILEQINQKRLIYKEIPVTIKYTDYSLKHGQSTLNAFKILYKMMLNKFLR